MAAAILWAFKPGRSQGEAATALGLAAFGGMFLLTGPGAMTLMAKRPKRMVEDLLREPDKTFSSPWRTAKLAAVDRCVERPDPKPMLVNTWSGWRPYYRRHLPKSPIGSTRAEDLVRA